MAPKSRRIFPGQQTARRVHIPSVQVVDVDDSGVASPTELRRHLVTRSWYDERTAPTRWGNVQDLRQGAQARLVDIKLPEPQPITLYMRGTGQGGVTNDHEEWVVSWSSGGREFQRRPVAMRVVGQVEHVIATSVRVEVLHEATSPLTSTRGVATAGIGSPVIVDVNQTVGLFTNAAPRTVDVPEFTQAVRIESSDPDWLGGPAIVEFLDVTGSPVPFNAWTAARFADYAPIEQSGLRMRLTAAAATTVSDAIICWRTLQ